MKTITITTLLSFCLLISSCAFNINYPDSIKGEGEVISEQIVLEEFTDLQIKRGWEVTLIPSNSNYMIVEANENLFEVLEYETQADKLVIGSEKQISSADSKKISLYYTNTLESIKASSGSELVSEEILNFENLVLDISSGADVHLELDLTSLNLETSSGSSANLSLIVDDLSVDSSSGSSANLEVNAVSTKVESSSGSDVKLKGSASNLEVRTSSGSSVNSKGFESKTVNAKASSGSSISVYPIEDLTATTSSGGDVYYYNKPSGRLDLNKSKSGGTIKLK